MGFPRKNDTARIYRDKDNRTYFVIFTDIIVPGVHGGYDAIANVYSGPEPSFVGTCISPRYISENWLKRMQFDELPRNYQKAIRDYLGPKPGDETDYAPESIRGFWRVGEQPA